MSHEMCHNISVSSVNGVHLIVLSMLVTYIYFNELRSISEHLKKFIV